MIVAHLGINELICTPSTFVLIARNGPPESVPGLGSQVSNWLGAPVSQRRMQCFCCFFASSAKAGSEKSPAQLATETAPVAASPLRNIRRWIVCSGVGHRPGGRLEWRESFTGRPCDVLLPPPEYRGRE